MTRYSHDLALRSPFVPLIPAGKGWGRCAAGSHAAARSRPRGPSYASLCWEQLRACWDPASWCRCFTKAEADGWGSPSPGSLQAQEQAERRGWSSGVVAAGWCRREGEGW